MERLGNIATFLALSMGLLALHIFSAAADTGTGDPLFPEKIVADGVHYHCKPGFRTVKGQPVRECMRVKGAGKTAFDAGTAGGIAVATGVVGGIAILGAIASDSDGGNASTVTSTLNFKR